MSTPCPYRRRGRSITQECCFGRPYWGPDAAPSDTRTYVDDVMPSSPPTSRPPGKLDLRVVVEIPLRQFAPWLAMVLLATWGGYPGVVLVTPLAWVIASRVGLLCAEHSVSSSSMRRLQEASLAGAWLGFLQGMLFLVMMPLLGPIQSHEQASAIVIGVGMVVVGTPVGAGVAAFTAYLVERRRVAQQ